MGYALFANRKLMLTSQLNGLELQLAQRSNEHYNLACETSSLKQQLSAIQSSQNSQLRPLYEEMSKIDTTNPTQAAQDRANLQAEIQAMEMTFEQERNEMQRQIDEVALKEEVFELEKQNLETRITAVSQELESVKEAEGAAIGRATPKYKGLG